MEILGIFCMFIPPLYVSVPLCCLHHHLSFTPLSFSLQLRQQVEGWAERVSDMESEMNRCEVTHSTMLQDVANKDERIMVLIMGCCH